MKRQPKRGMWMYLESLGILERGTDAEIKAAKQTYRKQYFTDHKRKQRTHQAECSVSFSKENGEFTELAKEAKRHAMPVAAFIRSATFAYIHNTFLVPNKTQVAQIELILSECLNEIKAISQKKEHFWERDQKIDRIEKRIERLEKEVDAVFRHPPLIENNSKT